MKKKIFILPLTLPIVVSSIITASGINNQSVNSISTVNDTNKIDINTIITITNLGTFHLGKTVSPSIRDINSTLKILNNPDGTKDANWHPNQWIVNNITVDADGNAAAKLNIVDWSPDYNPSSLTLAWIQSDVNPTTQTIASFFSTTNSYYNLTAGSEHYFPVNNATITGLDILKYLGTDTYRDGIDINQLNVTEPVWLDALDSNNVIDCYYVDLTPKADSNFYANPNEQFRIYFNKVRTNLSTTTPNFNSNVGNFYALPDSGNELKSVLKYNNQQTQFDSLFDRGTQTAVTTWNWNNTASTFDPQFTIVGNETYTTKLDQYQQTQTPLELTIAFYDIPLNTIFLSITPTTNTDLNFVNLKPNQYDIQLALANHGGASGAAITNFQWDQLVYQFNYNDTEKTGTVILTPTTSSVSYAGSVTVSFNWILD